MKLLLCSALLTALGFGAWRIGDGDEVASTQAAACDVPCDSDCDIEVKCAEDGACLLTCTDANGKTCEIELDCEKNCKTAPDEAPKVCAGEAPKACAGDEPAR